MTLARVKKPSMLALILGALLAGATLVACDSIGNDRENAAPTTPTPGTTTPQRGPLSITPTAVNLTVTGFNGGGINYVFKVTGGKPPFVWSNSWPQMGLIIPVDEFGEGYFNSAKYIVRDFAGTGNDFITVRDQAGAAVTAQFTKTIGAPAAQ